MESSQSEADLWQQAAARERDALIVSLPSFEGPLALLLELARSEKVDLARISMLDLAEQYLDYVNNAAALKLELAADYLVMAAWLAYLKSALLLPPEEKPDPDPEVVAEQLRWRLQRLQAMRAAGDDLMRQPRLGHDVFPRGAPQGLKRIAERRVDAELVDLLQAYARLHARPDVSHWAPSSRADITSLDEALQRLQGMIARTSSWTDLQDLLPARKTPLQTRSALASSFVAALELTRQGATELAQSERFGPLLLRARTAAHKRDS